ncbi:SusC/RagA family TonB-linked outer membrane protein [Portibacter lacus]|uniref:SusC/RagA family TonB-linked outer membrane protein n=1 Tax=Portibacter lacus TaxID=1099794 RepID=A0AA37SR12_9BACT|nr:TonB-dependent receptor [Portibacter lacus]GLR17166.1 SusC/RagA family TonB-linked outer membrane protein [Portibacter lacus]
MQNKIKNWIFVLAIICFNAFVSNAQSEISGKVTSANDEPIIGATIIIKGTNVGTTTDIDGSFNIAASEDQTLVFSYIGYSDQEVVIGTQTQLSIILEENTEVLDEVVVIGYGVTAKKDLVSSVSSIKGDQLKNQPVVRLDQSLQGRASGVEVTSQNGAPGAAATIRIRGTNSINGENNPLFVIDGFVSGSGFDLNNINANDVESIEILKDATALAIYGTRGAAGVIIITTKNGSGVKTGKPQISFNQYYSTQNVANPVEILGGEGYADYINESGQFVPGPEGYGFTDTSLPLAIEDPSSAANTDWLDLITQTGTAINTDLSIAGNSQNTNYYLSFNRFDQEGIIQGSGIERYQFRSNFDVNINKKLKTGIRLNVANYRRENSKTDYGFIIGGVLPVRTVYDEDGNYTGTNPITSGSQRNPIADIDLRVDHTLSNNITGNAYLSFEPLEGLLLKTNVGTQLDKTKNNDYLPGALPERILSGSGGYASIAYSDYQSLLNENTISYKIPLGPTHKLDILGGFSFQKNKTESFSANATGYPNDVVQFNNLSFGSDPETFSIGSGYSQRTFVSSFARINYSFNSKYLLTFAARRDGSSVFEDGNKYAFFPSVGFAWNIHEESFLSGNNAINRLKFRGSIGQVGQQGVGVYNSIAKFNNTNTYFNETLVNGVLIGSLPSKDLSWETTEQIDLGLELGLFQDRIIMELDWYQKTTKDLLLSKPLPNTAGGTQLQNIGSIQNRGLEFSLRSFNLAKGDFKWESQLTLSGNRNVVLELGGDEFINLRQPTNQGGNGVRLIPGYGVPVFVGATYLGTYKTTAEIDEDGTKGKSFLGSPRYVDVDGNGVINSEDFVVIGSPEPTFYGGFRNTFSYKGLSLDVFLQGVYGNDIYNGRNQTHLFGRGDQNIFPAVLDRWIQGVNETSDIGRAGTSTSLFNPNSTLGIEDGSHLRLKALTLGYDFPMIGRGASSVFQSLQVYVTGNNLFLLTNFTLGDPEVSNYGSSLEQGVATGQYPYARSFTMGVNAKF